MIDDRMKQKLAAEFLLESADQAMQAVEKFGWQENRSLEAHLTIIAEEFGEVGRVLNEAALAGTPPNLADLNKELTHVAATAAKMHVAAIWQSDQRLLHRVFGSAESAKSAASSPGDLGVLAVDPSSPAA